MGGESLEERASKENREKFNEKASGLMRLAGAGIGLVDFTGWGGLDFLLFSNFGNGAPFLILRFDIGVGCVCGWGTD